MTTENYSKSMFILKTFSKLRWWLDKDSCPGGANAGLVVFATGRVAR